MEREKLKSRLGFILLSAGCAIGIGNVWKFPYIAGQGGGGAFVLFYLIFLIILGLPIMTMEFAVGRASRKSPVRAYQALEKPGQKWHIHGYLTLIGCYLLMMFYTTVAGWMLHYFYMTATGKLAGLNADQVAGKFTEMLAAEKEGHPAGREMILETARQQNVALSQKKIRDILALMAQKGFATVSRGRGGSRITETGQKMWENNQITK